MSSNEPTITNNDPFAVIYPHEFISLVTLRKDGREVPTPVWFANDQGKIYVTTTNTAGKIKRVRNISKVFIAPSDRMGKPEGERIEGLAREVGPEQHDHLFKLLADKYPTFISMFASNPEVNANRTYIEIAPAHN